MLEGWTILFNRFSEVVLFCLATSWNLEIEAGSLSSLNSLGLGKCILLHKLLPVQLSAATVAIFKSSSLTVSFLRKKPVALNIE